MISDHVFPCIDDMLGLVSRFQDAQNLNLRVPLVYDMKTNMKEQTGVYPPKA